MKGWIFLLILIAGVSARASSVDDSIREQLILLADSSTKATDALANLRARPRADVIRVLREDLNAQPVNPRPLLVKAMGYLDAVELAPDLMMLIRRDTQMTPITVLTRLAANHEEVAAPVAAFYQDLVRHDPSSLSLIALLDGLATLRASIDPETFSFALSASNFQVRIAAVRHFLATRTQLDVKERTRRFRAALMVKPYQARWFAVRALGKLSAADQHALRAKLPTTFCKDESEPAMKTACRGLKP